MEMKKMEIEMEMKKMEIVMAAEKYANEEKQRVHDLKLIAEQNMMDRAMAAEKHIKELTDVVKEMFMASGSMFEQEHLRFINMFAATGGGGYGGGGGHKFPKAIMEHKVIQYLRAVNGDKSLFR